MTSLIFALLFVQDKATVDGVVINKLTHAPLRKAHVVLEEGKNRYIATSDTNGTFRFDQVEPGEYQAEAQHDGFFDEGYASPVAVAPGQQLKGLTLQMMPHGVIAGHVVDEDGDPVPDAYASYERSTQIDGRKLVLESGSAEVNGEGYFFAGELKAGRYYFSASPPEPRTGDPTPRLDFISTEDPVPAQLAPGASMRNMEIRLKKSMVFRVKGRVVNLPKEHPQFYLQSESVGRRGFGGRRNGDSFEFPAVPPGDYVLVVGGFSADPANYVPKLTSLFCRVPVTVSDHNVEDLVVELTPGSNLSGIIKIEGGKFAVLPQLGLQGGPMRTVTANEDGKFGWENLAPQKYWVTYAPPEGTYLKSVEFNRQPVSKMMIDLSSGAGGTLEMVVSPHAATVSGVVHDAKGNPAPKAQVVLWNDGASYWKRTDAGGAMKLTNLAPGEYRIAAWENVENGYLPMAEFRDRFESQKVTLAEGTQASVSLKLIPKSASDAEIAKLP